MKRIESFCVNHNKLKKGLYLSRVDGDAVTYDLRMAIPNSGTYLENDGIHTFICHLCPELGVFRPGDLCGTHGVPDGVLFHRPGHGHAFGSHRAFAEGHGLYRRIRGGDSRRFPGGMRQLSGAQPPEGKGICSGYGEDLKGLDAGEDEI